MKNYHKIITSCVIIIFSLALFGCGVSKEEHEKTLAELEKTKAELKQAQTKIAELSGTGKSDTGLKDKLSEAQKKASDLTGKLKSATLENSALKDKIEKLKELLKNLQEKVGGALPTDLMKKR